MARLSVLVCLLSLGCQASANAQVTANSAGDVKTSADAQAAALEPDANALSATITTVNDEASEPTDLNPTVNSALVGARAGLHVAQSGTATCHCLTVVIGLPNDAGFKWDGQASVIDPDTQLVVALSSDAVDCPDAPKDSLGASYHGYETVGADVTVLVETRRMGRPLANGAIVPKPASGGRLFVRPVDQQTPYGRARDGKDNSCIVWTAP